MSWICNHVNVRHFGSTFKMVVCAVKGCSSRYGNCKGISLFRLPKVILHQGETDRQLTERRRRTFLANIYRSGVSEAAANNMRICSRHFVSGKELNDLHLIKC
jgi:THAP domain